MLDVPVGVIILIDKSDMKNIKHAVISFLLLLSAYLLSQN